ncbi:MAG: pilus assembly protein [Anaerolineae bacterium]|nr:pilus assembly protein [Anaerolineae bacterium]
MKKTKRQKGQSLVEFALLLPILLIIMAGVLDLGRLYYTYVAVTDAAAEGASYASRHPNASTETITAWAQASSGGLINLEQDGTVEVIRPSLMYGDPITVSVSYSYTVATPFIQAMFPGGQFPLRAVASEVILTAP